MFYMNSYLKAIKIAIHTDKRNKHLYQRWIKELKSPYNLLHLPKNEDHGGWWHGVEVGYGWCWTNEADKIQEKVDQKNLDSRIIMSTIQFYIITHNSRSNHWIKLRVYLKILKGLFYIDLKC